MRHRPRLRAILAASMTAALAASAVATAPAASAAGPYDGKTVIDEGHVDVFYPVTDNGSAVLRIHDDTVSPAVNRLPEDVVFHVKPSTHQATTPANLAAAIDGFEVGETVYVLPQHFVPGTIYAGWGHDLGFHASITYAITDFQGPGNFATWQAGTFGDITELLNSTKPSSSFTSTSNHAHKNWGFTALGEYRLTMTATVVPSGGGPSLVTPPATYTFYVGEQLPDDGNGDPAPATTLTITGLRDHYHTGSVASLTAVQDPDTGADHYHWFTRRPGQPDWNLVAGASGATHGFIVGTDDDGLQVLVRLYDHDHAVLAESDPVTIVVDDHGNPPVEGAVISSTLDPDAGALIISVDEGHREVTLTDLELTPEADRYRATGDVGGIRVTDTRLDDAGWEARGRVRDFVTIDGDSFNGAHLGWTPQVLESSSGQQIQAGASIAPVVGGSNTQGLRPWRPLASAEPGAGRGTAVLGASLVLEAPTTIAPGTYRGLMILTVI